MQWVVMRSDDVFFCRVLMCTQESRASAAVFSRRVEQLELENTKLKTTQVGLSSAYADMRPN